MGTTSNPTPPAPATPASTANAAVAADIKAAKSAVANLSANAQAGFKKFIADLEAAESADLSAVKKVFGL
jgi:hypothetical protein